MESETKATPYPPTAPPGNNKNGKNGRGRTLYIILILMGIVGIVFGVKWTIFRLHYTSTEDAQVDADLLPISAKSPGRIASLKVVEGDKVRRGQVLAEIDPTDYKLVLERAEAGLEVARRELDKAISALSLSQARTKTGILTSESTLAQAQNSVSISSTQQQINLSRLNKEVERAKVNRRRAEEHHAEVTVLADQARTDANRAEALFGKGVISQSQLDQARTNVGAATQRLAQVEQEIADADKLVDQALNNLRAASIDATQMQIAEQNKQKADISLDLSKSQNEDVRAAGNNVRSLRARVRDMEAAVEQARIALSETRVISPVDGIVARRISQRFEIVPTGKPIFYILDTGRMWITANIEETFLHNIHIGSYAKIDVDALPGQHYKGRVYDIGTATNAEFSIIPQSNPSGQFIKVTQRIPIKIRVDGDFSRLRPGMNAVVVIKN